MIPLTSEGDGIRGALQRTADADRCLRKLIRTHRPHCRGLAILGVGGYGRGDNSLRSDLDLIFLHRGDSKPHEIVLKNLVQRLWDLKWSPGQTLLQLEDIDKDFLSVPDRASALLEARFIWGDPSVAYGLDLRLGALFDEEVWDEFIIAKRDEFIQRRRKYGEVPRVVEPYVKGQAGGLRDLHHVFWIERARLALAARWTVKRRRTSAILGFFRRLRRAGLIEEREEGDLVRAFDFLLRLREALRQSSNKNTDKLIVTLQPTVARMLGIEGGDLDVVVSVMRETSLAMEKIARFADEFSTILKEYGMRKIPKGSNIPSIQGAKHSGGRIFLNNDALQNLASDPTELVKLVEHCHSYERSLSGRARHDLRREIRKVWPDNHQPEKWSEGIRRWFSERRNVGSRLRSLSELDAIAPWLPEWQEISGLTTGSYYHSYTVDEHTLRALEELDNLPSNGPDHLPASLWKDFTHREWVYCAILMHDIAKGRPFDHSEEGAHMAVIALQRFGMFEIAAPVARLVLLHLSMEQFAFRRDPNDRIELERFAKKVGNIHLLQALYLLTVCDLRAVSPGVWTAWKGHLLAESYLAAYDRLERGSFAKAPTVDDEVQRVVPLLTGDRARIRAHKFIESMQEEYRRVVPAGEIAQHLEAVELLQSGQQWKWLIDRKNGYIVLTLIERDRVGLLAQAAGLMVSQGIGVREARIFTREDGIVIDRFRCEDIEPAGVPLNNRLHRLPELWNGLNNENISLAKLLEGYRRRYHRRKKPTAYVETEIVVTSSSEGYLIDVSGQDTVGVLYRLCSILASEGLDVRAARVSFRVDGIMNSFLVRDPRDILSSEENRSDVVQQLRRVISEESE